MVFTTRELRIAVGLVLSLGVFGLLGVGLAVSSVPRSLAYGELLDENLRAVGAPRWTEEEQAFARKIQAATGKEQTGMFEGIKALPERELPAGGGSTDVAEVSRMVPTAKLRVASAPRDAPWHAWPVVACGGMSIGHKAMTCAARALGGAIMELAASPRAVTAARREFEQKTAGAPYSSPIPEGQAPPVR